MNTHVIAGSASRAMRESARQEFVIAQKKILNPSLAQKANAEKAKKSCLPCSPARNAGEWIARNRVQIPLFFSCEAECFP